MIHMQNIKGRMPYRKNAFTLVEILVSLTLLAVLMNIGILGLRSFMRYNVASGLLNNLKNNIRFLKHQTYALREKRGEYTHGIGMMFRQDKPGSWQVRTVRIVTDTIGYVRYLPYPQGNLQMQHVRISDGEEADILDFSAQFDLTFASSAGNLTCDAYYVVFETPLSRPHYYCERAGILNSLNIQYLDIGVTSGLSKVLRIDNIADIYIY